jgi:glycine/D-amino acid oxidase-like deaminating enzyme
MLEKIQEKNWDAVIVGAGLLGSSVALHLAKLGVKKVLVCDIDLEGAFSSSERNAGGVRATWWQSINIQIGIDSLQYFRDHAQDVGFQPCGYTFLYSPKRWELAQEKIPFQKEMGVEIQVLKGSEISKRFPFFAHQEEIAAASFSPKDGLINPNQLKNHFRQEAKKLGVSFLDRFYATKISFEGKSPRIHGILKKESDPEEVEKVLSSNSELEKTADSFSTGQPIILKAEKLVNCAGAWSPKLAATYGEEIEAVPLRRQIAVVHCPDFDMKDQGMMVDTSGLYFHPEAENIMVGYADPNQEQGIDFQYDEESFFMEFAWPTLWNRIPKCERLKHLDGWAGLYGESKDSSAIVGQSLSHENLFEAHSFSGRGAMQSPSIGKGLAEKIVHGEYKSLDLSPLSRARFQDESNLLYEKLLI